MCDVQLVRHHDDGDALFVEFLEHAHDLDARLRIEIAGGLVCQQQRGLIHERPSDGYALLLSARKLTGKMIRTIRQPDELERLQRPISAISRGKIVAAIQHWQLHVFYRRSACE